MVFGWGSHLTNRAVQLSPWFTKFRLAAICSLVGACLFGLLYRALHVTSVPVAVEVFEGGGYRIATKPIAWRSRWDLTGIAPSTVPYRTIRKDGTVLDGLWVFGLRPEQTSFHSQPVPVALECGPLWWRPNEVACRSVQCCFGTDNSMPKDVELNGGGARVYLPTAQVIARGGL